MKMVNKKYKVTYQWQENSKSVRLDADKEFELAHDTPASDHEFQRLLARHHGCEEQLVLVVKIERTSTIDMLLDAFYKAKKNSNEQYLIVEQLLIDYNASHNKSLEISAKNIKKVAEFLPPPGVVDSSNIGVYIDVITYNK
jgi:hypothetical protein